MQSNRGEKVCRVCKGTGKVKSVGGHKRPCPSCQGRKKGFGTK